MQGAETAEAVTQLRNLYQHFKQRTLHLDRHVCAMMDARLPALVDMASVSAPSSGNSAMLRTELLEERSTSSSRRSVLILEGLGGTGRNRCQLQVDPADRNPPTAWLSVRLQLQHDGAIGLADKHTHWRI